ncbi:hypothetical protein [Maribacter hydrothermalis]|uniref:Fibronectin type-III domain-containing protein n=1 Tax=Maribacter hydrothermalis TaxID=1836467 RepID=A0A1B7Z9N7_9FLAO|nr:hypothetical protein [Maribacter hydrothermalis]APQ16684.1 hypothetical protein BTR34_04795 [Maribacter hydrothermalis]OBR39403.1 hypothetical protein A9200_17510 [Maribacter hydrothermalis]
MKILKYITILFFSSALLVSCGGGSSDETPVDPIVPVVLDPNEATLVFPEDNTECNEGVVNANDSSKSTVTFEWTNSENTDSYEIKVKNLETGSITTASSTTNQKAISINRGSPYEWYVISLVNGTSSTATSETWSFYNQGQGIENYAPFPAIAISPLRGSTISNTSTTTTLEWSTSDVDDDIISYEILFDTIETPTTSLGVTEDTTLEVTISPGNIYYWMVITKDSFGNTSNSELFEFRVE